MAVFGAPVTQAKVISTPALKAYAKARATIANIDETRLTFTYADIENGVIKRTSTHDYLSSLMAGLANDLDLEIQVLGLGLGLNAALLKPALSSTVGGVLGAVDDVVASLLEVVGVTLGEADIRVNGVRCDRSVLVQ
jgi:uncharacterized membrane protein